MYGQCAQCGGNLTSDHKCPELSRADKSMARLVEAVKGTNERVSEDHPTSVLYTTRQYPCGCRADGVGDVPSYCGEHGKLPLEVTQFDLLAGAIGWSKELCAQTGDSPFDVARDLLVKLASYKNNRCDDCGATINYGGCGVCGAPSCCPQCCRIDVLERRVVSNSDRINEDRGSLSEAVWADAVRGSEVSEDDAALIRFRDVVMAQDHISAVDEENHNLRRQLVANQDDAAIARAARDENEMRYECTKSALDAARKDLAISHESEILALRNSEKNRAQIAEAQEDLRELLFLCIYSDSFDTGCHICGWTNHPGIHTTNECHKPDCIVPRLEAKYPTLKGK